VLCVGQFNLGLWGTSMCCLWDGSSECVGSDCVLCVGMFGVGLGKLGCAVCGTV